MRSSNSDQIVQTFCPSFPSFCSCLRQVDGPCVAVAPGKNPSTLLQVGKTGEQQAVKPRLAPASPTKVLTQGAKDAPSEQVPLTWSVVDPPLTILLPIETPIEWPITTICLAPVQARTASRNFLIFVTASLEWQTFDALESLPLPHVVVQSSAFVQPFPRRQVARLRNPVCQYLYPKLKKSLPSVVPRPKATSLFPWTKTTGLFLI